MAVIQFANGTKVNFNGNPTPEDVEEVAASLGLSQPEEPNQYGARFRATGQETGTEAGLKALGNVPSSAANFGKGILGAVTNPKQTAKAIGNLIADTGAVVTNKLNDVTGLGSKRDQKTGKALANAYFGENGRYGSLAQAQKTAIEDPFGVGSDILSVLQGGAAVAGKTTQLNNVLSKTAKVATSPVTAPVSAVATMSGKAGKFGLSQTTGLSPETISTITKNPRAFGVAQAEGVTRADLATDVFDAIKKASDDVGDLGTGYEAVRKSGQTVALPDTWMTSTLDKYGFNYDQGKIVAGRTSKTRNATDITKIQSFVDNWGDSKNFTAEEYLNMRHDLAELAKYDMTGSTVARDFASTVREGILNSDKVRTQIPGLKKLDAKYAEDIKFYKTFKKDFLTPDGTLKDGAASKIVNSVNVANPERLARLEKLYPGFTKQAKVVKAVEDVESAMGLKVGTYMRAGAGIAGIATGNVPLIISAILSTPEIAVPLLKGYGYTAETVGPVLRTISETASDINNFRSPVALNEAIENRYSTGVPVGMSITPTVTPQRVGKAFTEQDFYLAVDGIEDVAQARLNPDFNTMLKRLGLDKAENEELIRFLKEATDINADYSASQLKQGIEKDI